MAEIGSSTRVSSVIRQRGFARPGLLIEWRSPRIWIEALEERRVLDGTTAIPTDVPAGYFRYWGAGSNPADRPPELAVPFLEGREKFEGIIATFWGDAPKVTRVYVRLDNLDSLMYWRERPEADSKWQRVEIIDVPGPTFEVSGTIQLPEKAGLSQSSIVFVDDIGGPTYASDGPIIMYGNPAELIGAGSGNPSFNIVFDKSDVGILYAAIVDRLFNSVDQYQIVVASERNGPILTSIVVGQSGQGLQSMIVSFGSILVPVDITDTTDVSVTVRRLDGRASATFATEIVDRRPAPIPVPTIPTPADPTEPVDEPTQSPMPPIYNEGLDTDEYTYPSSIEQVAYLSTYYDPIPDDVQFFVQINGKDELPAVRKNYDYEELLQWHTEDLYIEPHALDPGENQITIIGRRNDVEVYRDEDEVAFAYERHLAQGRKWSLQPQSLREGETTLLRTIGIVYDISGFSLDDYEAALVLDNGDTYPVNLERYSDGPRGIAQYRLSSNVKIWLRDRSLGSEQLEGVVTVSRGDQSLAFSIELQVSRSDWLHPLDSTDWLDLPPAFSIVGHGWIVDDDTVGEMGFDLLSSLPDGVPLPEVKIRWSDYEEYVDANAIITKKQDGGFEVIIPYDRGVATWYQAPTLSLWTKGKLISGSETEQLLMIRRSPAGNSDLFELYEFGWFDGVAGLDYAAAGVGVTAFYLVNGDPTVTLDEYTVDVRFDDGSTATGFISFPDIADTSEIAVNIQGNFKTTGRKDFEVTVRYRDREATFNDWCNVFEYSDLAVDPEEWVDGRNELYKFSWGTDVVRTEKVSAETEGEIHIIQPAPGPGSEGTPEINPTDPSDVQEGVENGSTGQPFNGLLTVVNTRARTYFSSSFFEDDLNHGRADEGIVPI